MEINVVFLRWWKRRFHLQVNHGFLHWGAFAWKTLPPNLIKVLITKEACFGPLHFKSLWEDVRNEHSVLLFHAAQKYIVIMSFNSHLWTTGKFFWKDVNVIWFGHWDLSKYWFTSWHFHLYEWPECFSSKKHYIFDAEGQDVSQIFLHYNRFGSITPAMCAEIITHKKMFVKHNLKKFQANVIW